MAVESSSKINLGKNSELRLIGTSAGAALTTTAAFLQFPALSVAGDSKLCRIFLTPRNFSTAVVIKIAFNPWLTVLKTTNDMATIPTDYSLAAQDNDTTVVDLSSLDTVANGDWVLLGAATKFRGFYVDVLTTNSTSTTTAAVHYRVGDTWVAYTITDGTKTSTALDKDGLLYWTPSSAWEKTTFSSIYPTLTQDLYYSDVPMYWIRYSFDKALDSTTTLYYILTANRSTSYGEIVSGQLISKDAKIGFGGLGNIEALTDAGTANLVGTLVVDGEY